MEHCNNCKKSLSVQKFHLHLRYCLRNIKPCPLCNLPYDLNNIEEHYDQYHKIYNCSHCNQPYNPNQVQNHGIKCLAKPMVCEYCELPVPGSKFEAHRTQCEAKTQHCQLCNKLILNKEAMDHKNKCVGPIEEQRDMGRKADWNEQVSKKILRDLQKIEKSSWNRDVNLNKFLFQTQDQQLQAALLASLDQTYSVGKVQLKNS